MFLRALACSALLLACCASPGPARAADTVYFDARPEGSKINFRVERDTRHNNNWSQTLPIAAFDGLNADAFTHDGRVEFRFVRPAGTLACEGLGHDGRADGRCTLTPNQDFAHRLAAEGLGEPSADQNFALTMSGVSLDVLDALRAEGWQHPSLDELVELGIFQVTADRVRALADVGYKAGAIKTLVSFQIFKVTPDYIRSMRAVGLRELSAEMLVQLRIFNITPDYVRAFTGKGDKALSAHQLVQLRIAGVDPDRDHERDRAK